MWFSPIKGAYLTLGQIDKTARAVSTDSKANTGTYGDAKLIKRGMFLMLNDKGNFEPYPDKAGPDKGAPYIALQNYSDYQAGAAGSGAEAWENGNATGTSQSGLVTTGVYGLDAVQAPAITGLSTLMDGEYQTNAFDTSKTYKVGSPLTVKNGVLTLSDTTDTGNVVGYVTAAPFSRWVNDLNSDNPEAHFTGGNAKVIQWTTHFIATEPAG